MTNRKFKQKILYFFKDKDFLIRDLEDEFALSKREAESVNSIKRTGKFIEDYYSKSLSFHDRGQYFIFLQKSLKYR